MSITSRINEIETHLKEDYTNLEALGYDIPQDKNIENIASVLDNVWENQSHIEETGTTLSMNTNKGKAKVDLLGNTYQETTTGKNLLNVPSSYSITGKQQITLTLPAGTYHITCGNVVNGGDGNPVMIWDGSSIALTTDKDTTKTLNEETTLTLDFFSNGWSYPNSQGITSVVSNLMISTSGGDYEPYTNGASPNPSYPQPIQVVSGDNSIISTGKNWFNVNSTDGTTSGASKTIIDDNLILTSNAQTTGYCSYRLYGLKPNTQYTLTYQATSDYYAGYQIRNYRTDGTYETIKGLTQGTNVEQTFTTPNDIYRLTIYFYCSNSTRVTIGDKTTFSKIQIEEGNATTYQTYTSATYPIYLGVDNLFDSTQGVNGYINNSGNVVSRTYQFASDYIPISSDNSYTISLNTTASNIGTAYFDSNKGYLTRSDQTNIKSHTFTPNSNWKYIRFWVNIDNSTTLNATNIAETYNVQMEEGTKANSYTPYGTTPIELCKIGTYQDKFFKAINGNTIYDNLDSTIKDTLDYGEWYLEKNTTKINIQDLTFSSFNSTYNRVYAVLTSNCGNEQNINGYCNVAQFKTNASVNASYTNTIMVREDTTKRYIYLWLDGITTEEQARTYLSNNTDYFVCQKTIPTYTKIEGTLASQLEDVWRANTYDNQTNVSQVNNDLPFELYFKALGTPSNTLLGLSRNLQLNEPLNEIEEEPIEEIEEQPLNEIEEESGE